MTTRTSTAGTSDGCVFCGTPLPPPRSRGHQRVICDAPECKSEASRYGARIVAARTRRRTLENPPTERHCRQCGETKPLTEEFFYIADRTAQTIRGYWDRWCRACRCQRNKERYARRREQGVEQLREQERNKRQRRRQGMSPEELAADRRRKAEASRRWRERHPERSKEAGKRARDKVKADPARHRAAMETNRIAYRLRRERQEGVNVVALDARKTAPRLDDRISRLPAKPLAEYIFRRLAGTGQDATEFCVDLGMSERLDRMLYAWKVGEREAVNFDVADRIITRLSVNWWDVWADGDDYLAAQRAFEGDPLEAAA